MASMMTASFSDYRLDRDRDIKPSAYLANLPSGFSAFSTGASALRTPEKAVSIPVAAPSAYRPALPRSTSMQPRTTSGLNATTPAARSRLNLSRTTSVCSVPTVIPESSIIPATSTTATSEPINVFKDVGFRNRAFSEGANGQSQLQQQLQQQQVQSSRYKTELCRPFEENGKCKYSDKCQFAHGKHELRNLVRHPKYKTELCRTFHTSGFCRYGPRCHFIHNTEDANTTRATNAPNSFAQQSFGQSSNAMPVPEPQNNVSNHYQNSRPAQLELIGKQFSVDSGIGTYAQSSYSPNSTSPLNGSPISDILGSHTVLSPLSPPVSGSRFSFNNNMLSGNNEGFQRSTNMSSNYGYCGIDTSSCTPPNSTFDLLKQQINSTGYEITDDTVFEPLTPPDSDRESMTGSPSSRSSQQRLPIFRCLSHSD